MKIDKDRFKIQWADPRTLTPNPVNHRKHPEKQKKVLRAALDEEGWIDPVIYNKQTGHIVDGHARVDEAIAQGAQSIPMITIDVDLKLEKKIVARHDRIGALAELDLDILGGSLAELGSIEDLGWDLSELEKEPVTLKPIDTDRPIGMIWYLIGVPLELAPSVSKHIEAIQKNPDIVFESSVNDAKKD